MKRKILLLFVITFTFSVNIIAQDTYVDDLKYIFKISGTTIGMGNISESIAQILTATTDYSEEKCKSLAEKYVKDQLYNDLAEIYADQFRSSITAKDLSTLRSNLDGDGAESLLKRLSESADEDNMKQLIVPLTEKMLQIVMGASPEPIKLDPAVTKSYVKKFRKYSEQLNLASEFDEMLASLDEEVESGSLDRKTGKKIRNYFRDNLETIFINYFSKYLQEKDLELLSNPAIQKFSSALDSISVDDGLALQLAGRILTWAGK